MAGYNWGGYADPHADELALKPLAEFDITAQNKLLADLHAYLVDQAMWIFAAARSPTCEVFRKRSAGSNLRKTGTRTSLQSTSNP